MDKRQFDALIVAIRRTTAERGGYILNEDINELLGDEDIDIELIEQVYERIAELNIDFYDTKDEAKRRQAARLYRANHGINELHSLSVKIVDLEAELTAR